MTPHHTLINSRMPARNEIHSAKDARRLARRRLPRLVFDFIDGAAGYETTARRNRSALTNIRLQPRVLLDVKSRTLAKTFLGEKMGLPFGIAPMGMCNLAWPGADSMLADAAARHRIPLCVSTAASTAMETLRQRAGRHAWFQLYAGESGEASLRMALRAQEAGYDHLILTVDAPQVARRPRDLHNGFQLPFRLGIRQVRDFALHPRWSLATLCNGSPRPVNFDSLGGFARHAGRSTANMAFLEKLRAKWLGKLIVKGISCTQDARRVVQAGADAIYVSNHGGRQLDSAPPSVEALAAIRAALGADCSLVFDSGVRSGEDVVKALALGADFVMLGRPLLYALGAGGARGLSELISLLAEEIDLTLAQLGARSVTDVDGEVLASQPRVVS